MDIIISVVMLLSMIAVGTFCYLIADKVNSLIIKVEILRQLVDMANEKSNEAYTKAVDSEIVVKAMEKSTHSVQYVPMDNAVDEELSKFQKEYLEELEEEMPFFAPTEEDRKVRGL